MFPEVFFLPGLVFFIPGGIGKTKAGSDRVARRFGE